MPMELMDKIRDVEEGLSSRRVFGEPYEKDGVTMIPAAKVNGGVGGGGGEGPEGEGSGTGSGFGLSAKPVGMYVISDGLVSWRPAVDVNRMILGGQLVTIVALLVLRSIVRSRALRSATASVFQGRE
jgi:uncharacterized spore protein YtfJ